MKVIALIDLDGGIKKGQEFELKDAMYGPYENMVKLVEKKEIKKAKNKAILKPKKSK